MRSLDDVVADLAALATELAETPTDTRRAELRRRQSLLREEARSIRSQIVPSRGAIVAELEHLQRRWDDLAAQRIDIVKQAGEMASSNPGNTYYGMELNRAIDAAQGRDEIEQRMDELKRQLAALDGD
jgi:hypothetical protein